MKIILQPTDFSRNGEQALIFAANLAQMADAKLIVLHVFDIPTLIEHPYETSFHKLVDKKIEASKKSMVKWAKGLLLDYDAENIEFAALNDPFVADSIIKYAIEVKADMIVAGTRGESKLKEFLLGSTTRELIQESPVPVLAFPPGGAINDIKKIAFATDYHPKDLPVLLRLKAIAEILDAEIIVTHVLKNTALYAQKLNFIDIVKHELQYKKLDFKLLSLGDVNNQLSRFIIAEGIGILAMLEKDRGVLSRIIQKDRVLEMEDDSIVPLLSSYNEKFI